MDDEMKTERGMVLQIREMRMRSEREDGVGGNARWRSVLLSDCGSVELNQRIVESKQRM